MFIERKLKTFSSNRVTLKALANASPGFALKPWVQKMPEKIVRNPDKVGVAPPVVNRERSRNFRVCRNNP